MSEPTPSPGAPAGPGAADGRVPLTLVTGFLGAGKTTLVNRILQHPGAGRVAVVVNEFGEVPLDGRLIVGADEELVELSNGCLCCTVRGDLVEAVGRLLDRRRSWLRPARFDRLVVEPSGLASPGPVVQTFLVDPKLAANVRVDGVVAVAAAPHVVEQLATRPEAGDQLAYADLILLNHADRGDTDAAEAAVRQVNGLARIVRTVRCDTPIGPLLDLGSADPARWRLVPARTDPHAGVSTVSLTADVPLDLHKLKLWLQLVANDRAHRVLRLKAIVRCADHPRPVVAHGVYGWLELGPGAGPPPHQSVAVLIGVDLDRDRLQRGWDAVRA